MTDTEEAVDELTLTGREEWRAWLAAHHASRSRVWLVYYKKHTGRPTIPYDHAVEEALCYGWIDGRVKRIDGERYKQMFTPRRPRSIWSAHNKRRVEALAADGRMAEAGLAGVREARANGMWDESVPIYDDRTPPPALVEALERNDVARRFYEGLGATYKRQYHWWILSAKRSETRERRIRRAVELLEENRKLGA